jgi:hypothetical protein
MADRTPLAIWVREVRGRLTQKQFGRLISRHEVTVANWERSLKKIDTGSVEEICRAFPDAPPPPGLVPARTPLRAPSGSGVPQTAEGAEIAALVDSMSVELRRAARAAIYGMLQASTNRPSDAATRAHKPRR